jgi:hypothetical protein
LGQNELREQYSVFQIIYEAHPEGAVDEMIALTNDSIMSEMIDGADAEDDNRPGAYPTKSYILVHRYL